MRTAATRILQRLPTRSSSWRRSASMSRWSPRPTPTTRSASSAFWRPRPPGSNWAPAWCPSTSAPPRCWLCRQVWRRERVTYDGKYYQIPLPADHGTGLGKPLQLINHPVRERIPITIAALGPKNVELTAEIAEGWQPVFFYPEKADAAWGDALRAGAAKRDPALGPLDVMVSASLAIGDDVEDRLGWAKP